MFQNRSVAAKWLTGATLPSENPSSVEEWLAREEERCPEGWILYGRGLFSLIGATSNGWLVRGEILFANPKDRKIMVQPYRFEVKSVSSPETTKGAKVYRIASVRLMSTEPPSWLRVSHASSCRWKDILWSQIEEEVHRCQRLVQEAIRSATEPNSEDFFSLWVRPAAAREAQESLAEWGEVALAGEPVLIRMSRPWASDGWATFRVPVRRLEAAPAQKGHLLVWLTRLPPKEGERPWRLTRWKWEGSTVTEEGKETKER
jgi:hypothetical protein